MTNRSKIRTGIITALAVVVVVLAYSASASAAVWCWNPVTGWVFYPYAFYCSG
jgi:hypothetical protein